MNEDRWLAAYLFYAEPWTNFLSEAVLPFVNQMLSLEYAKQFFFIRYWESGPHIRLRFKGNQLLLENELQPRLEKYFKEYFHQKPSTHPAPLSYSTPQHKQLPNNSIQYIQYEPEIERYGGNVGIIIAEQHFYNSSSAVLNILNNSYRSKIDFTYDRALGAAIQLHLSFVSSLGMTIQEAQEFFRYIADAWLPSAIAGYYTLSPEEKELAKDNMLKVFSEQFERQRTTIITFCEVVWKALAEGIEFENEWLNLWILNVKKTSHDFLSASEKGSISFPIDNIITKPAYNHIVRGFPIFGSYVHMTNNRLGIHNQEEAYIGFLILRSLELVNI